MEKNNDYNRIMSVGKKRGLNDRNLLEKANDVAMEVHKEEKRYSGEPFIIHPWAVARMIADWGLETSLIATALLHDVLKHGKSEEELDQAFSNFPEITKIVKKLTMPQTNAADKQYQAVIYDDNFSDSIQTCPETLYIKIAAIIHNLKTLQYCSYDSRQNQIAAAKNTYLPLATSKQLLYITLLLEDACFEAEYPKYWNKVKFRFQTLLKQNKNTVSYLRALFEGIFLRHETVSGELLKNSRYVYDCIFRQPLPVQIFRSHKSLFEHSREASVITKYTQPLYHIFLVLKNICPKDPVSFFMDYYLPVISIQQIIIIDLKTDDFLHHSYFVLEDRYENRYRLYLYTQEDYEIYMFGDFHNTGNIYSSKNLVNDTYAVKKISVKTKDLEPRKIALGATALDFAFLLHENIGLCAKGCLINGESVPLNTVLSEDDIVEILVKTDANNENIVCAQIEWFEIVKTGRAVNRLVKWFRGVLEEMGTV